MRKRPPYVHAKNHPDRLTPQSFLAKKLEIP